MTAFGMAADTFPDSADCIYFLGHRFPATERAGFEFDVIHIFWLFAAGR
jgi:hypothetical protein